VLRRVIGVLVSGALIGPVVIHAQGAAPKNRDDDTLLLIVGRSQLQDHPEFTCVIYFEEQWKEKPVSDWLLNRLRRYRPGLVKCDDNMASDNALLLGPIEWTPSKVATVKFGGPIPLFGSDCYFARRGFFGRWQLTRCILE
jgi:hypothetical protein